MDFISYYRVSTAQQGASGLGLEAQKHAVESYCAGKGEIIASFTDIESGKNDQRPQLHAALAECRRSGATLACGKLDRISRSVGFIFALLDSGVEFVCADMPMCNTLTIGIFAALAQYERELISKRTKEALQAKKARGCALGNAHNLTNEHRSLGRLAQQQYARENKANINATELCALYRDKGMSLRAIADKLNTNHTTRTGRPFKSESVRRLLKRAQA